MAVSSGAGGQPGGWTGVLVQPDVELFLYATTWLSNPASESPREVPVKSGAGALPHCSLRACLPSLALVLQLSNGKVRRHHL